MHLETKSVRPNPPILWAGFKLTPLTRSVNSYSFPSSLYLWFKQVNGFESNFVRLVDYTIIQNWLLLLVWSIWGINKTGLPPWVVSIFQAVLWRLSKHLTLLQMVQSDYINGGKGSLFSRKVMKKLFSSSLSAHKHTCAWG